MATVTPNRDKKTGAVISYRFRCCYARDAVGRQLFATMTWRAPEGMTPAKALKAAKVEAENWEAAIRSGYIPVKRTSFDAFVNEVFLPLHVMNGQHKPATIANYRNLSARLIQYFGNKDLSKITSVDLQRFVNNLLTAEKRPDGKPLSKTTVRHYTTALNTMFNFAMKHDLLMRNPMLKVEVPQREKKPVEFLDVEQARRFLDALEEYAPARWRCFMRLLLERGLRRGEAVGLRWEDVDFQNRVVCISRSVGYVSGVGNVVNEPKTETSRRVLPLADTTLAMLRLWQTEQRKEYFSAKLMPSAYVFGAEDDPYSPMCPTAPERWLRRFTRAHGLPRVSPHDLRHTCGSLMLMSGATVKEVQDTLGHADASTTLKFYVGTTPEALRQAADNFANALKK